LRGCLSRRAHGVRCRVHRRGSRRPRPRGRSARSRSRYRRQSRRDRRSAARGGPGLAVAMRVGVFTDSFEELSLDEVLTWLEGSAPEIRDLEIGTGGYSPARHCDLEALVEDESERTAWLD